MNTDTYMCSYMRMAVLDTCERTWVYRRAAGLRCTFMSLLAHGLHVLLSNTNNFTEQQSDKTTHYGSRKKQDHCDFRLNKVNQEYCPNVSYPA